MALPGAKAAEWGALQVTAWLVAWVYFGVCVFSCGWFSRSCSGSRSRSFFFFLWTLLSMNSSTASIFVTPLWFALSAPVFSLWYAPWRPCTSGLLWRPVPACSAAPRSLPSVWVLGVACNHAHYNSRVMDATLVLALRSHWDPQVVLHRLWPFRALERYPCQPLGAHWASSRVPIGV